MKLTKFILIILITSVCPVGAESLFIGNESRPVDAVVLFDGKDLSGWKKCGSSEAAGWKVENGYMEIQPGTGSICTKQMFTDCQLHIEFWLPLMANAQGQARANSGVYLQGRYEVQVLDSYGLKSQDNDCGGIYKVAAPMVNACRPPEQWQTYDILFHAPKFDDKENQTANARISVLHNGIWIHDNVEIPEMTTASLGGEPNIPGPIMLQDHGNTVRYRNVWIRPL